MHPFNVAIVGCGWVSDWHVRDGLAHIPHLYSVVACCDTNLDQLSAFGARYGIGRRTTELSDILAMSDVDVVVLCTPPSTHYRMILAALAAKKNVVCEKPLTSSLALVDEIIEAERSSGKIVMPIFQYRFGNEIAKIRNLIKSGILGQVYVASAETAKSRGPEYYKVAWRGKFATELGGVLLTQSIHTHDLLFWLLGPCHMVSAFKTTRVNPIEVEDCAVASLIMQDGSLASLTATLGSVRQIMRLRFCFARATLELQAFDEEASRPGNTRWNIFPITPEVGAEIDAKIAETRSVNSGFVRQYELFHGALQNGSPAPVTLEDARRSLELITGIFQSAETGQAVKFPIGPDTPKYSGWVPKEFFSS